MAAQVDRLRGYLSDAGRDPAAFGLEFAIAYGVGPERWQRSVELAEQGGVSHFSVNTMSSTAAWAKTPPSGFTTPAEHIGGLEQFIKSRPGVTAPGSGLRGPHPRWVVWVGSTTSTTRVGASGGGSPPRS